MKLHGIGRNGVLLTVADKIFGTRYERGFERRFLIRITRRVEVDLSLALEHPGNRVRCTQVAAGSRQLESYIGHRACRVVGERLDDHRHPTRSIRFVSDFLVVHPFQLARPLLDRPFDVVLRHRGVLRGVDRSSQARIARRITPALAGGYRDLPDQLGEQGATLCVSGGLVVLDLLPFAVTGHDAGSATGLR